MFRIKIADQSYQCPTEWGDITLADAVRLQQMVAELPAEVKAHFTFGDDEQPGELSETISESLCRLGRDMLMSLAKVPEDVAERVEPTDLLAAVKVYFGEFIVSLLGTPITQPTGLTSFECAGKTFRLPAIGTDIIDNPTPLHNISAVELCEASDLVANSDLRLAPVVVAILCRPEGESYDEDVVRERARSFAELPANIYMELLYLLNGAHDYLRAVNPLCYGKGTDGDGKAEASTWYDRMLLVAGDRPSELSVVKQTNAYEFMGLLSGRIKREKELWRVAKIF